MSPKSKGNDWRMAVVIGVVQEDMYGQGCFS